jgi:hypothetical protein
MTYNCATASESPCRRTRSCQCPSPRRCELGGGRLCAACGPSLASNLFRPTFDLGGRGSTLGADACPKHAGWFVVRVLRHEFTPERLGEDGVVTLFVEDPLAVESW